MKTYLPILLVSCLFTGCTSGSDADKQNASSKDKALLEAVKKPLEQARQVERQTQKAAEAERGKIEKQEQSE